MRPLSSDLREFIHLLNTNSVKYVIVGAWALAFHGRPRYTGDLDIFVSRGRHNPHTVVALLNLLGLKNPHLTRKFLLGLAHLFPLGRAHPHFDPLPKLRGVSLRNMWTTEGSGKLAITPDFFLAKSS